MPVAVNLMRWHRTVPRSGLPAALQPINSLLKNRELGAELLRQALPSECRFGLPRGLRLSFPHQSDDFVERVGAPSASFGRR